MTQIKHEIKVTKADDLSRGAYYFDFSDYTEFTDKSELYIYESGLAHVHLPLVYGSFYQFKKGANEKGLLQVVNIQKALGYINLYVDTNLRRYLSLAEDMVSYIVSSGKENDDKLFLPNGFYQPLYMLEIDWISGMAQGQFTSLCILLFRHTSDSKYLHLAEKSINVMLLPVTSGGCAVDLNGELWFEEYVNKNRNSFVLNGNVFSVLGLYDFFSISGKYKDELNSAISCLVNNTPLFFTIPNVSRYDLRESLCDASYNHLHCIQYDVLYRVLKNKEFKRYSDEFSALSSNPNLPLSFILKKNYWRLIKLLRFLIN